VDCGTVTVVYALSFFLNQAGQIGCKSVKLCQQFQVSYILFSNPARFYWSVSTILGNFCLHH
jgi:hypothetical protein